MPQPLTIRAPVSRPTSPQLNPGAAAGFGEQRRDPPDAEDAVHVIPDGAAQHGGVDAAVHGDGVVGQVVNDLELLIQQLPHVGVQPVDEGEAVVLPGVILKGESAGQTVTLLLPVLLLWLQPGPSPQQCPTFGGSRTHLSTEGGGRLLAAPCEVLVAKLGVLHEAQHTRLQGMLRDICKVQL